MAPPLSAGLVPSLEYPSVPLYRLLQDTAKQFPERTAVIAYDGETRSETSTKTYRALDDESSRLAAALTGLGVHKGTGLLTVCRTHRHWWSASTAY